MKITPELLLGMGASREQDEHYLLRGHGYSFWFLQTLTSWAFKIGDEGMTHYVTDIEEVIILAYVDGLVDGQDMKTKEIKEVLQIQ